MVFSKILDGAYGLRVKELAARGIASDHRANRWMIEAKKVSLGLTLRDYAVLSEQVVCVRDELAELWRRHEDGLVDGVELAVQLEPLVIRLEDNVREREALASLADAAYLSPTVLIGNQLPDDRLAEIEELLGGPE